MKISFFILSWILLALCFLPALSLPFAHHDIVRFFDKFYFHGAAGWHQNDPQYSMAYLLGRPLTAWIQQAMYHYTTKIGDLTALRWLTVCIFAIGAGSLANILYSLGLGSLGSLCLSVALFILPGVQDAMIMIAIQNALALCSVLWAYKISSRQCRSRAEYLFDILAVLCLLLASMLLYPQWSFFIFVPALVKYLLTPAEKLRSMHAEILKLTVLFYAAAFIYYLFIKTFVAFNNTRAGSYAFTIDLNFFYWKLISVFSKVLPMAFNFWDFHTSIWAGLILMGSTLVLLKKRAFVCSLMILSTTSLWLLARTDLILHRIFFVTSALALTGFLLGVRNSKPGGKKFGQYMLAFFMAIGLLGVHELTYFNALNYNIEFSFIKQRLTAHHGPYSRIHIVLPAPNGKGYNGQETVDDIFNARTASYNFDTDTVNLVRAALKDINVPDSWKGEITYSKKGAAVKNSPGMVLIDMDDL